METDCFNKDMLNKAQSGDPQALFNLGYCFFFGLGIKENYEKAIEYWYKSSLMEYAKAQYFLLSPKCWCKFQLIVSQVI
jgi:uncharacterized protein